MFFRLLDSPEKTAVGKILSIYEDGPTFEYPADPDKVEIDPNDLTIGRKLWIRFRQPFLEEERYFEMEAEIVMAMDLEDEGTTKLRLRYTRIDEPDRKVLAHFIRGKREPGDEDYGTGGVPARLHPRRPSGSGEASPPEETSE